MVRRSTIAILCATELLLSVARPARADDVRDRAAAAFDQGVNRFRLGDSRAALAAFQEAYRLVPNPEILYNIGQTQLALEDEAAAYGALDRYLAESTEVSRARRTEVTRTLRRLRPRIAALVLAVRPRDARVSIDDGPADPLPVGGVVYVAPGQHRVELRAGGHRSQTLSVEVAAAGERRLEIALESRAEPVRTAVTPDADEPHPDDGPAPTPESPRRGGLPVATFVFGTAAVAAIAVGSVTGGLALARQSEIDDARAAWRRGEPVDRAAIEDRARGGETLAAVTDAALAIGVASAGAAVFFWLTAGSDDSEPSVGAAVAPLPGGAVLTLTGATP